MTDADVTLLRDVRPWGGDRVDLHVTDGRISAVTPHVPAEPAPAGSEPTVVFTDSGSRWYMKIGCRLVVGSATRWMPASARAGSVK